METFIGQIVIFPYTFAPQGFHACDGSLLPISGNAALYSLIGTKFGGNGTSDFALPDYRKIAPAGSTYCIAVQGSFPQRPS